MVSRASPGSAAGGEDDIDMKGNKYGSWVLTQSSIDSMALYGLDRDGTFYEINRRYLAEGYGVRVAFLDKVVKARRKEIDRLGIRDEIEREMQPGLHTDSNRKRT